MTEQILHPFSGLPPPSSVPRVPNDPSCALVEWSSEGVCSLLSRMGVRSVLFVGDSIAYQQVCDLGEVLVSDVESVSCVEH